MIDMSFEFKYNESDFCTQEAGIQYVFTMFSVIYGAKFASHWGNLDTNAVMETWKEMLGKYLTYKPTLKWAIQNLGSSPFVPTPMMFFDLCKQAGRIPVKPEATLTHQKTQAEIDAGIKMREEAMVKIKEFTQKING